MGFGTLYTLAISALIALEITIGVFNPYLIVHGKDSLESSYVDSLFQELYDDIDFIYKGESGAVSDGFIGYHLSTKAYVVVAAIYLSFDIVMCLNYNSPLPTTGVFPLDTIYNSSAILYHAVCLVVSLIILYAIGLKSEDLRVKNLADNYYHICGRYPDNYPDNERNIARDFIVFAKEFIFRDR